MTARKAKKKRSRRIFRAGIAGTGRIAGELEADPLREHPCTHAGIYAHSPRFRIAACCGRTPDSARAFAEPRKIPGVYADFDRMLEREALDVLSVCTPAPLHAPMVIRAAQAGVRAIFCEKPLATSLPEARRMIRACREYGAVLLVNHLRRWGWDYRTVRKMLAKGAIGRVQSAAGCFSGNLLHTGTHLFDILRFLFGEWTSARGRLAGDEGAKGVSGYHLHDTRGENYADPGVIGTLIFENGVEVFVSGLPRDYFIFELDIVGSKGRIRIGNHLLEWWKPAKSRYYASFIDLARAPFPRPARRPNPWLEALADIRRVLERGAEPASTGTDGLKSLEAAFALAISSRRRGARVRPPVAGTRLRIRAK